MWYRPNPQVLTAVSSPLFVLPQNTFFYVQTCIHHFSFKFITLIKNHSLFNWFRIHFGSLLGIVFKPNLIKKSSPKRKRWFSENEHLGYTRTPIWNSGASKASQKTSPKPLKKQCTFGVENHWKWDPKWTPKAPKMMTKRPQETPKMQHKRPMLKSKIRILQGHSQEDLRQRGAAAVFRAACSMLLNATPQTSKTTPKVTHPTSKSGNASSA